MKTYISSLLMALVCLLAKPANSYASGADTSFSVTFLPQDSIPLDTQFTFCFVLETDSAFHLDSITFVNDTMFTIVNNTLDTGWHQPGIDTFCLTISLDTTQLSTYLRSLHMLLFVPGGRQWITGYFYATPWNTLELHSGESASQKKWIAPTSGASSQRSYIHPDSLPNPPDTSLPITYVTEEGLGYLLPINYDPADTSESSYKASNTFSGQATGRVVFKYVNDVNSTNTVDLGIAGVKVQLYRYRNRWSKVIVGDGYTDDNGNFSIDYDFTSAKANNRFFVKISSQGEGGEVMVLKSDKNGKSEGVHEKESDQVKRHHSEDEVPFGNITVDKNTGMHAFHWANRARSFAKTELASLNLNFKPLEVFYKFAGAEENRVGFFTQDGPALKIVLGKNLESQYQNEGTIYHETGHYVMFVLQDMKIQGEGGHQPEQNARSTEQALSEGFAHGFSAIVDSRYFNDDQEATFYKKVRYHEPYKFIAPNTHPLVNEWTIGTTLLDLWDSENIAHGGAGTNAPALSAIEDRAEPVGPEYCALSFLQMAQPFFDNSTTEVDLLNDVVQYFNILTDQNCQQGAEIAKVFNINIRNVNYTGSNPAFAIQNYAADDVRDYNNFELTYIPFDATASTQYDFEPFLNISNLFDGPSNDYNVGDNEKITQLITEDITLRNGVTFSFLKNGILHNRSSVFADNGMHNNVHICKATIDAGSNSIFEIGHDNGYTTANVYVEDGSVLDFDPLNNETTYVVIHDDSRLVIEPGAELKVGSNFNLELEGDAVLEIKGALTLDDNATLSFTGSGKVIFNSSTANHISFGNNASIELVGSGQSDVIAEIHQDDLYALASQNTSGGGSLTFKNGKVLMGNNTRLATSLAITIDNCLLEPLNPTDEPRGIYLYGQEDVVIKNSNFKNMRHGIKAEQYFGTEGIEVDNCDFDDCQYGITTWGRHAQLDDCDFTNCEYGWYARAMTQPSEFYLGTISHTTNDGINYHGGISPLHLRNATVEYSGFSGVSYWGNTLSAFCSDIDHNQFGMGLVGTELILSDIVKRATGYVEFDENRHSIVGEFSKLYLEDGKNKLEANQLWRSDRKDIEAYMQPTFVGLGSAVFCNNNQWSAFIDPNTNTPRPPLQPDRNILVQSFDLATLQMQDVPFVYANTITQRPSCPSIVTGGGGENAITTQYASGLMENPEVPIQTLDFVNTIGVQNHEFEGDDAEMAIILSVSDMYFQDTDPDQYEDAVNRLADILMAIDHTEEDPYISFISEYAYQRMMEGFGFVLKDDKPTALTLSTKVFDVQDRMIDLLEAELVEDTYYGEFKYNMDKALTHHALDDRVSALSHLNGMVTDYTGNELLTIQNVTCKVQFEKDVLDGTISILDTEQPGLYLCDDAIIWPEVTSGTPTTIKSLENRSSYSVALFPNPSDEQSFLKVETDKPTPVKYEILDLSGRSLHKTASLEIEGSYVFTIDQGNLNSGSYLLRVYVGDEVERQILVKQ